MRPLVRTLALLPLIALGLGQPASAACPECAATLAPSVLIQPLGDEGEGALAELPRMDPGTATRRALFFPGGGHFYTGETARGAALLGVAAGSVLAGALLSSSGGTCTPQAPGDGCEYDHERHEYRSGDANRTPLYVGIAAAAGAWLFGIVDARASATRVNTRNGVAFAGGRAVPEPLLGLDREGRATLGLRVRLTP